MSGQVASSESANRAALAETATERFLVLDGLRGVAAFAVILDHMPSGVLGGLVPNRALSVDFFFVLSGFVLAHAYGPRLESGWSPWAFMRARLIRLYPFYIVGTLIGVLALVTPSFVGTGQWPGWANLVVAVIPALFFLPALPNFTISGGALYPCNGPAWSLFFELLANVIFAFVARFLSLRVLAAGLFFGAIALTASLFNHADVRGPGWLWPHFDAGIARALFAFFAGVAIYRLRDVVVFPAMPWWAAVAIFIVIIAIPVGRAEAPAYDAFAAIVLFPALVAGAARARVSGVVATGCAALGLLSYGVYAVHEPLIRLLSAILGAFGTSLPDSELAAILVAAASALLAAVVYRVYDVPVRAWLARVLPGGSKAEKPHIPAEEHG